MIGMLTEEAFLAHFAAAMFLAAVVLMLLW
jgi:hypothetical protein